MQKVLKTWEALEKQKDGAESHMQKKEEEEKLRQIMQNHEDKLKEHVQKKKKKKHAQMKAAEIEHQTRGSILFGQTEGKGKTHFSETARVWHTYWTFSKYS